MTRLASRFVITLTLLLFGWIAGRAQAPEPEFTLAIDAPAGRTSVVCVKGCTLQGGRDEGNPSNRPVPNYFYECSGATVKRCSARVNGWVSR
jgi:hypothetical protein